jgi:hypothetical protein
MNLKKNATREQLARLIAEGDDKSGNHMLWVSKEGEVTLDIIPDDLGPIALAESLQDRLQFRVETLLAGNDYVGPKAAKDAEWIGRLFTGLTENWNKGTDGYVDSF